jgi:hypothetical protein
MWKSAGRAPSLRVLPWHLPYNWGKSTEKPVRLRKTSVRVQYAYYQNTHTLQNPHKHTHYKIHTYTHTHTHVHTHTHTLQNNIVRFLFFHFIVFENLKKNQQLIIQFYVFFTVSVRVWRWPNWGRNMSLN